jgi:hypothetical protein
MWRQTNRGQQWLSCDPAGDEQPTNSLRYFLVDGQTELYACRYSPGPPYSYTSGLWKSDDNGDNWDDIGTQGMFGIDVRDFARTPGSNHPHYFVLYETGGGRGLKHSTDPNLQNWSTISGFIPPINLENIVVTSMNDDSGVADTLWLRSASNLIMLSVRDDGVATELADITYDQNEFLSAVDYSPAASPGNPYPTIYAGRRWSFEQFRYNSYYDSYVNYYLLEGTNQADIAAISESGLSAENGGGLYALSNQGAFVFFNKKEKDPNWPNIWEAKNSLLRDEDAFGPYPAIGVDISTYYYGGEPRYIAIANSDGGPRSSVLNNGNMVYYSTLPGEDNIPAAVNACGGLRLPPSLMHPGPYFVGLTTGGREGMWRLILDANQHYFGFFTYGGLDEPVLNDLWVVENRWSGFSPFSVGGPPNNKNAVFDMLQDRRYHVDLGLENVDVLSSVMASEEDPSSGLTVLYAGVQDAASGYYGIYKNHFDKNDPENSPWYRASYGIGGDWPVLSLVTTKHLIDCGEPLDPFVVYALCKNPVNEDRYFYISADSARSWIEIGQYLRDNDISVDKLELIIDEGTDQRYYVVAAGEDGVYRCPYNVKSGEITGNEIWEDDFYIINGDLIVTEGASLTIGPNASVLILYDYPSDGYEYDKLPIIVDGSLSANGVTFKSSKPINPQPGDWQGFVIGDQAVLTLVDCTIEHANDAIIALDGSHLEMTGCSIVNSDLSAITATYPSYVNISETGFTNNNLYAISIMNENANVELSHLEITGINRYGIRYFGNSPDPNIPLIDNVTIAYYQGPNEPPPPYFGIEFGVDEMGYQPMGRVSNAYIEGYEDAIHLNETVEGITIGPNVHTVNNVNGIFLDHSWVEINGSEGFNNFEENEKSGFVGYVSAGKVRSSKFIGSPVCIIIWKNGDVIDFGREESEEDWGNNWIVEGPGGSDMLFYVNDCEFEYPAQMNWWGSFDPAYIESMVSECVIWDPWYPEPPELHKLSPDEIVLPKNLTISRAYPNPFNAHTTIKFTVPRSTMASVVIYNILGQEICELYNQYTEAGEKSVIWDGKDDSDEAAASGVYLYAVRTDDEVKINKMTLLK